MTVQIKAWQEDVELDHRLGNCRTRIVFRNAAGENTETGEVYISGWNIDNGGNLFLQRRILVFGDDPDAEDALVMTIPYATHAQGTYGSIEQMEYAFDPDAIRANQEAQRQQAAAAALGAPMPGAMPGPMGPGGVRPMPNRQARRHPGG